MNDFEDGIRAALHADAEQAPVAPADWQPGTSRGASPATALPGRHRRLSGRGARAVVVFACVALVAAGVVAVAVTANRKDGDGETQPIDTASTAPAADTTVAGGSASSNSFPAVGPEVQNFLIAGADSEACTDPNSPWAGAADPSRVGTRSDTIMILRLDPVAHRAAVLSFPRDLWVKVAGHGKQRINTAYVPNDYSLLAQTIYDNFGITVDHYFQVDFCAFKRIVDAVGGVAVPFATPVRDRNVGMDITAPGCHTFSGDEALAYVRSRHLESLAADGTWKADPTADFGRIARQQDFLRRVLARATEAGLGDPAVVRSLIESLQTDVVTEAGFTIEDMLGFAGALKDIDPASIQQFRIDGTGMTVAGNSVLAPALDTPETKTALALFRGDAPLTGASARPAPEVSATTAAGTTDSNQNGSAPIVGIVPDPTISC